ncbi:MAG TPA: malto-oligosyltrehalose synthase [Candidatus Binatia bacterium]|nr:malto-oligosyltrehalose synthase [Candidatus Binatia bacterium]
MRIPSATYRLQFTAEFGFAQVREVLGYLRDLGIGAIYASPIFHARAGSTHGYDVVDPNRLNPELGSAAEFENLSAAARSLGLGWVQDIVPNHMAYDAANPMLVDVLENGPASMYADFFDIDWNHPYESMKGKVLAPFLGRFYGECLEDGEITLHYEQSGLKIRYFSSTFPVTIEAYSDFLTENLAPLRKQLGSGHLDFIKLLGVLYTLKNIAPAQDSAERADQIVFVKRILWELYTSSPEIRRHIDANLAKYNGTKGEPETFNALDRLLGQQWFRLSFWKVAAEELDYRRFFNINELISLRMEEEKVYRHTHRLVLQLAREGKFTGLRVDHVDGLYDPLQYLRALRRDAPEAYLIVEKILSLDEELPAVWPIQGTTGYEFLNYVNGIFCAREQRRQIAQIYSRFTGIEASCAELMVEKKRLIIGKYMAGDIEALAFLLKSVSSRDRQAADVTLYGMKRALVEVLSFFPVYRSYISPEQYSAADRDYLSTAVERAKTANPGLLLELNFIERFLLLRFGSHHSAEEKQHWTHFAMRFQQLTGPLMAKGFEDTALYVFNRLLSLNDVGGDPDQFGITVEEFHHFNQQRQRRWPHTLNTTATHDTKRGEDARARINVLSELPHQWESELRIWSKINRPKKSRVKGGEAPDRNDEYFLYQTLIGSYPAEAGDGAFTERLTTYLVKAVREAKVHTEWLKPDAAYEEAFVNFAETILAPAEGNAFLARFVPFARKIAHCGMFNSLSQAMIKIAAPGVPDLYQGTELWDLSFVDPDNRRPVDFVQRARMLAELRTAESADRSRMLAELLAHWEDGRIKLHLLQKLLAFRRDHAELFAGGEYISLGASGPMSDRICAFARRRADEWAVAVAPRLLGELVFGGALPLGDAVWGSGALVLPPQAPRRWCDLMSQTTFEVEAGNQLSLGNLFREFPVCLLYHEELPGGAAARAGDTNAAAAQHNV